MAEKKDPAFLFYSKDWIQGTAQMMPNEKGVYIDLLAHQHQERDLPNDTKRLAKMVGLSLDEFMPIWDVLSLKFIITESNRLVNRKLTEIATERSTKGLTNRITGTFASIIRLSDISFDEKQKVKKMFKVDDFITVSKENLTDSLTIWLDQRLKSIADANGNNINTTSEQIKKNPIGSEVTIDSARKAWDDQKWRESICMSNSFKEPELKKWMASFNSSVMNDVIDGFDEHKYKKLFNGWLQKQKGKGYNVDAKKETVDTLKKL